MISNRRFIFELEYYDLEKRVLIQNHGSMYQAQRKNDYYNKIKEKVRSALTNFWQTAGAFEKKFSVLTTEIIPALANLRCLR